MQRPAADGFLENSLNGVPKVQVERRISQAKGQKDGLKKPIRSYICLLITGAPEGSSRFSLRTVGGEAMKILEFIAGDLNDFIWGWFGIAILLGTGILMTVLTKFFQITHFGHWMKSTIGSIFN